MEARHVTRQSIQCISWKVLKVEKVRVAIIGAGGYGGAELVSLLLGHSGVEIVGLYGSAKRAGETFAESWPRFRGRLDLPVRATDIHALSQLKPDAVFLATPHEASVELAPELIDIGTKVLDLSGGFRFKDAAIYPAYYGFEHKNKSLLESAVYGLPELFRAKIKGAQLISVPGCYPTSAILPLAPLVRAGAVRTGTRPIIDSTSGVSGAGRSAVQKNLFCEVSLQAYNVFKHRHNPEIDAYCGCPTLFTPHVGAFDRGILSTIHVELASGWTADRVGATLRDAYSNEAFVRLCPSGVWPAVNDVRMTNFCDIAFAVDERHAHLIIESAIDNLVKGAAGQAIQCLNIRFGLPEIQSLLGTNE